jgi:hypothetical protein
VSQRQALRTQVTGPFKPRLVRFPLSTTILLTFLAFALLISTGSIQAQSPPYPPSSVIQSVAFDRSSHVRGAPGSDNWPITWADDGHQYTSWGDGGGFGGTNSDGRVSLAVARIEGDATNYQGFNVWGAKMPKTPPSSRGKATASSPSVEYSTCG